MAHLVLLGDSIFDNASYTGGEPDVIAHVRSELPQSWRATLLAVDGATTSVLAAQLTRMPPDASHLAIAVGGNDALGNLDLLSMPVRSTAEALALFDARAGAFEDAYRRAVAPVVALGLPTTICTIYNGNLPADQRVGARVALSIFNDVIVRFAHERGAALVDLRLVCTDPEDYANPIEPSGRGGRKIARALVRTLGRDS